MLERTRQRVGLWYAQLHFRRQRDQTVRFGDAIARARRALVIYPEAPIDWESTQMVLKYFTRRYAHGTMVVLVREDLLASVPPDISMRTISYAPGDVNAWFVPRGPLLRKMKSSTFDIAFDLNVGLALPSAFLCKESNAPLRVSFAKEFADRFYNVQLRTASAANHPAAYRNLLKCLDMF